MDAGPGRDPFSALATNFYLKLIGIHSNSLYLMMLYSSAKRTFVFISLCCLSAPAIAACSDEELREYVQVDVILMEYKKSFKKSRLVFGQFAESQSRADGAKYCQLERRNNKLSLQWLSLDGKLKEACPIFYSKWLQDGKEARDLFNNNQPRHQRVVDGCEVDGL